MLTNDKTITTPEYWNRIYAGKNDNAKVDASNTKRPVNPFDRFSWVAAHAEGPRVLGIASGHAHIEKRIAAAHPDWLVLASDQAIDAQSVANYNPYIEMNAYDIQGDWDMIVCSQAMEYMEDQDKFLQQAKAAAKWLLITVPLGEMAKWSQLRIYTKRSVQQFLSSYGDIVFTERVNDLFLVKLKFND